MRSLALVTLRSARVCGVDAAQVNDVAADVDAELPEQSLADGGRRHAGGRLAGGRPLEDVARVVASVFQEPGEIRMAGTRPPNGATAELRIGLLRRGVHDLAPALPVTIANEHGDRGADGLSGPHPAEELHLVALDLHPAPASIPLLPSGQLRIDMLSEERQAGGNALEDRDERWPVRFTGGGEAQHDGVYDNEEKGTRSEETYSSLLVPHSSFRLLMEPGTSQSGDSRGRR